MKHISLDLETLGTGTNAAIIQIGAVEFDLAGNLGLEFRKTVCLDHALDSGAKVDAGAFAFWMGQSEEARYAVTNNPQPLGETLRLFMKFVAKCKATRIWGNGATFDNRILAETYQRYRKMPGIEMPWHFTGDRDMRTLLSTVRFLGLGEILRATDIPDGEIAHDALCDAKYRAQVIYHAHRLIRDAVDGRKAPVPTPDTDDVPF